MKLAHSPKTSITQKALTRSGLTRRALACSLALASLLGSGDLLAQSAWPTRPVRLVVPSPAGTAPDVAARIIGERLARIWGQNVVIENKPGAGGIIALSSMKSNEKDDHQFIFVPASTLTLSPYMYKSKTVDIPHDLVPVAYIGDSPMVLAVNANSPYNTFNDLLAAARKQPDTLIAASPTLYSLPHLVTVMLAKEAKAPMRAIPYSSSGQSSTAVLSNDAQVVVDGLPALDGLVKGGRLKGLATFSAKRLPGQPGWPAVAETYPGFTALGWFGVLALNGMSPAIIDKVNKDVNAVIVQPDVVEKFESFALFSRPMPVAEFGSFITKERTRWEQVLRDIGAQPLSQ